MALNTVTATINGQSCTLTLDPSTGKWVGTITAPATTSWKMDGHYYPVTLKATDKAGNSKSVNSTDATLGKKLQLRVKEVTAPTITVTAPTASQLLTNNKPEIKFTVVDDGSGVDPSTIKLQIDSLTAVTGDVITKKAITNGYECTYTPAAVLTDGTHTLKINASDYDGNAATQKQVTFKVDTVPPTLSVASPAAGLITNNKTLTVSGTTDDVTSKPVTITVNGKSVTVGSNGTFSTTVELTEGDNTITVIAKDAAGKTTTVTRKVTLDTVAQVFVSATLSENPITVGKTLTITVEVTD